MDVVAAGAGVMTGPGNTFCAGTETGACCVPFQQGVLGWPVQQGAGWGGWGGCPVYPGNPAPDWGRLGQRLLACGEEPEEGQLLHRASEC